MTEQEVTVPVSSVVYLCPRCGAVGKVEEGFMLIDARLAPGYCTGDHVDKMALVRSDLIGEVTLPKGSKALKNLAR